MLLGVWFVPTMPNPLDLARSTAMRVALCRTSIPALLFPLMRAERRVSFSRTGGRAAGDLFSPPEVILTMPWLLSRSCA